MSMLKLTHRLLIHPLFAGGVSTTFTDPTRFKIALNFKIEIDIS